MEESSCPGQSSRSPSRRYHSSDPDRNQTSDSDPDQAANIYTFSEEITYNSSENSVADDVSEEEVTSYGLNQPPHKRPKNSPTDTSNAVDQNPDWISSLPDSVLLHILSFLPAEDAVATGVLSKRWLYLWTAVPNLVFRYRGSWGEGIWEFADFVSRTLLFYGCANVKKFHVDFEFHEYFQSQVHGWVRFAMRHDVEELDLDFYGDEDLHASDGGHYKLPQFLYSYGLLKKLNLRFCQIVPNGLIDWKFLKILSISYAILSDDLAEKILSGSPVLESLELYKCCGISYLDVKSASLRKLVVNDYWDSPETNEDMVLEISGPNLQSLGILGFLYGKHCRVRNVSSLIDVTLNFQLLSQFDVDLDSNEYEEYQNMLREILENLHHVKKLTIGKWCIQVLSKCEMREMPSPLSKRNYLILDTCLHRWESWDLPGIASLLRSSPAIETLVINVTSPHRTEFEIDANYSKACDFIVQKYFNFRKMNFKNSLASLKTVEVVGFIAGARQSYFVITLLEFLLKNARVLEKMVICAQTHYIPWGMSPRPEDLHTVGQRLLNFPGSSPYAEIILRDMKD